MGTKPKLLILADDELVAGAKRRYYKEYNDLLVSEDIDFITLSDAKDLKENGELDSIANPKGELFVLNPYKQMYFSLETNKESCLERDFVNDKSVAYKRALLNMGAKCVIVLDEVKDKKENKTHGGIGGNKNGVVKGELVVDREKELSLNISSKLMSLDLSNMPEPLEKVKEYLVKTGLISDSVIKDLYEQLESERKVCGIHSMDICFLSELKSSIDIAAKVDLKAINAKLNVAHNSSHIHEITKRIRVFFEDVPDDIREMFTKI